MKESKLVTNTLKALKDTYGGWWINVVGHPRQRRGIPDILGICEGIFFGLEAKLPGKEADLTESQKYNIKLINKAGGVASMFTSVNEAKRIVSRALREKQANK